MNKHKNSTSENGNSNPNFIKSIQCLWKCHFRKYSILIGQFQANQMYLLLYLVVTLACRYIASKWIQYFDILFQTEYVVLQNDFKTLEKGIKLLDPVSHLVQRSKAERKMIMIQKKLDEIGGTSTFSYKWIAKYFLYYLFSYFPIVFSIVFLRGSIFLKLDDRWCITQTCGFEFGLFPFLILIQCVV
jgi:hypothetical protein